MWLPLISMFWKHALFSEHVWTAMVCYFYWVFLIQIHLQLTDSCCGRISHSIMDDWLHAVKKVPSTFFFVWNKHTFNLYLQTSNALKIRVRTSYCKAERSIKWTRYELLITSEEFFKKKYYIRSFTWTCLLSFTNPPFSNPWYTRTFSACMHL